LTVRKALADDRVPTEVRVAKKKAPLPKGGRPHIPDYGISTSSKGLLPWSWAEQRLKKSREYWFISTLPAGAPHVMPVWGVWVDSAFYFSTGRGTRKARNLARDARCVICNEHGAQAVIVHGRANEITDTKRIAEVGKPYARKYPPFKLTPEMGAIYEVRPETVFGLWEKKFPTTATRWKFKA
jgi:nitroimidazol reductase NimA-like FMN-containing flavoprotein (pyridoxamine 5'-phosphate oxidase superfamily)